MDDNNVNNVVINKLVDSTEQHRKLVKQLPTKQPQTKQDQCSFGYIGNNIMSTFINLLTDGNELACEGQECYYLLTNEYEYQLPVICKGKVLSYDYSEGLTRDYYMELHEILDEQHFVELSLYWKPFTIHSMNHNKCTYSAQKILEPDMFENPKKYKIVTKVNSFFSRRIDPKDRENMKNMYLNIQKLRKEYIEYIIYDLDEMIKKAKTILL